ncbi:hypothetical protein B0T25DRAFT_533130 [Lasiosphaeria hispida]|uniref:Secreted protein n=1 Tax=Lasiosphaeria hispida TaxID=260671 RepID=A0AAJ0MHP3_9PEZI|nr:hypothetical protein B0T25DRAFT_533130 [Lasiosphaeria hispida]
MHQFAAFIRSTLPISVLAARAPCGDGTRSTLRRTCLTYSGAYTWSRVHPRPNPPPFGRCATVVWWVSPEKGRLRGLRCG